VHGGVDAAIAQRSLQAVDEGALAPRRVLGTDVATRGHGHDLDLDASQGQGLRHEQGLGSGEL
jgi:hypothetical protein